MSFSYENPSFSVFLALWVWWLINLQLLIFIVYLLHFETALYLQDFVIKHWFLGKYQFTKIHVGENEKKQTTDYSLWKYLGPSRLPEGTQGPASFPEPSLQNHKPDWRSENFMPTGYKCSFVHPTKMPAVTKAKKVLKQGPTTHKQISRCILPHQVLTGKKPSTVIRHLDTGGVVSWGPTSANLGLANSKVSQ